MLKVERPANKIDRVHEPKLGSNLSDAPSLRESPDAVLERLAGAEDVYAALGLWCRSEREQHGWNQTELANRIGVGRTSVVNLEAGRQRILTHTLVELFRLFKEKPALPAKPVVTQDYRDACDCPAGWVTCSRNPCARAERISDGIREYTGRLVQDGALEVLADCGALPSNRNDGSAHQNNGAA